VDPTVAVDRPAQRGTARGRSDRRLLRTRPNPLTYAEARQLRGARPAGPPPRPRTDPVTVTCRASNSGIVMVAGQKIAIGCAHPHGLVTVHVAEHTITIDFDDGGRPTYRRATTGGGPQRQGSKGLPTQFPTPNVNHHPG
jgi:hypothetical protein